MAFNQTEKQEKEYLKQIISFLKKVIGNTDASVKDHVDTLAEYKDYIWSNKDIDRFWSCKAEDGRGWKGRRKPGWKVRGRRTERERRRIHEEDLRREGERRILRRLPERFRWKDSVPKVGKSGRSFRARF